MNAEFIIFAVFVFIVALCIVGMCLSPAGLDRGE